MAGGVSANSYLREVMLSECEKNGIIAYFPPLELCTDNAAMIGSEAYYNLINGEGLADLALTANPSINLKYSYKK